MQFKKKLKISIFFLVLTLFPLISAVEFESGTIITNYCLDYNFTLLSNLTVDKLVINSTCEGDINNLTAFYNPILLEINNTKNDSGIINVFNLTQALIFNLNGTLLHQEYTGDINLTIEGYNTIVVENNFIVELPDGDGIEGGAGLNQDGGDGNTKINNTLIDSVLIKIYNLDNSFIYFSNGTILTFLDGDLNITLTGSEYFYIINCDGLYKMNENSGSIVYDISGNNDDGTITGATWNNDGFNVSLTNLVDYKWYSTGIWELLNSDLDRSEIIVNYSFTTSQNTNIRTIQNNSLQSIIAYTDHSATQFNVVSIAIILTILISLFFLFSKFLMKRSDKKDTAGGNFT